VHVSVFVGNVGRRSLDRAAVSVLVSPCCANASEVRREWFPPIPAGKWVRLDLVVSLPNGAGMAAVSARPGPSIKAAHESQPQNNETIVLIGDPSRPR